MAFQSRDLLRPTADRVPGTHVLDELVRLRTELRDTEERFRVAHEFAAFGCGINALDGRWLHVNPSLRKTFGYSEKELFALTFQDVTHPKDVPAIDAMVAMLIAGEAEYLRKDTRCVHKHGHAIWCEVTLSLMRSECGAPLYFISQIQDLSKRMATQHALRESESQLRFLFENMTEGVVHRNQDGEISDANPAAQAMLGLVKDRDTNLFKPGLTVLREDGSALPFDEVPTMQALRTGTLVKDVLLGIEDRNHGVTRWVLETAFPQFKDGSAEPHCVFATFKDVTQSRQTIEALRLSQERLQIVLEQAPAILWTTDRDLNITWCDGAAFNKLTTRPADAIGQNLNVWFGPDSEAIRVHREALLEKSGHYEHEVNGSIFDVHVEPLRDRDRNVIGAICLALDMSDARRAEQMVKHQEDQLRQAQKMEAIGRLAGGVAHDFNNLLTAITGHVEFAAEALDPRDPVVDDLQEIRRSADRAASLTRQLLAFSRRQVLQASVIDMNVVAAEQRSLLKRLIGEDVELKSSSADEDCCIFADRSQIEQVIMNLAVNARDAMPGGGILTIDIAPVVLSAPLSALNATIPTGDYARLTVEDTGTGISQAHLKQIFEPFFTTKPAGRGTGLGLSTVYGIIQQTGGYIVVDTEPGKGTRFDIYLPRVFGGPDENAPVATSASAKPGETILVVEDEPTVRTMAERILKRRGYKVLSAQDGDDATTVAEMWHGKIDLLLTDIIMPNCGGRKLAEGLPKARPGIQVLFMSGYTDEAIGELTPDTWFIQKPFTPTALATRVRQVLDSVAAPHDEAAAE